MSEINEKLAQLITLENSLNVLVDELGENDALVLKIKKELNQINATLVDLMIEDQNKRIQDATIL